MDMLEGDDEPRWESEPVFDPDDPTIARAMKGTREFALRADVFGRVVTALGFVIAFAALVGAKQFQSLEQNHFSQPAGYSKTAGLVALVGITLGLIVALLGRILTWVKTSALLAGLAAVQTVQKQVPE